MLTLAAGLVADGTDYGRASSQFNVTIVLGPQFVRPIEIAPRDLWPSSITSAAKEMILLEFVYKYKPANRDPKFITWTVDGTIVGMNLLTTFSVLEPGFL